MEFNPAIVKYIGDSNEKFTKNMCYKAYFLEYWQGVRDSLHVSDNMGQVTDYNSFRDFEVISDENNLLNKNEATVRCISDKYDDRLTGLTFGNEYKAIGRDLDGFYLVMDNSKDCYFYPFDIFEVVEDKANILARRSVYYSYHYHEGEIKKV